MASINDLLNQWKRTGRVCRSPLLARIADELDATGRTTDSSLATALRSPYVAQQQAAVSKLTVRR